MNSPLKKVRILFSCLINIIGERIQKEARNKFLKDHVKDIKKIQKALKENRNRKANNERLAFLKKNPKRVIKVNFLGLVEVID
jgi:hypothetical protein